MSDISRDPTDERNERIAARLETEPLDDVTRARLVRAAMDAAASEASSSAADAPRSRTRLRWLSVAAAVVVVLAVGFAVLARNDSDSERSAARTSRPPAPLQDQTTTGLSVPEGGVERQFNTAGAVGALGDLGDVANDRRLRRAIAGAEAVAPSSAAKATDEAGGGTAALPRAAPAACVPSLPGDVVAIGTGTARGKPVTVYVVEHK